MPLKRTRRNPPSAGPRSFPGPLVGAGSYDPGTDLVLGGTMSHMPPPYPPQPGWAPPPPAPRRRWPRVLAWVVALPVLGVGIGWGAVLVTEDRGDPGACKTALAANYRDAVRAGDGAEQMPAPSSCKGLSEATLKRITGEVIAEYLDSPEAVEDLERSMESAAASP
jgi:hypothetical protein